MDQFMIFLFQVNFVCLITKKEKKTLTKIFKISYFSLISIVIDIENSIGTILFFLTNE